MPRLTHLAIAAKDPHRLAEFYRRVFDLKTVREDETALSLSDGVFSLVLLPIPAGQSQGLHYIGFHVEDNERTQEQLEKSGWKSSPSRGKPRPEPLVEDPDGNLVALSKKEFEVVDKETPFPIHHIALYTPNPQRLCDFYCGVFGMREIGRTDRSSIFVSDRTINLALLFQRSDERLGLNHFGFHVKSNKQIQRMAEGAGVSAGGRRPDRIPYAEYRLHDPEGNGIDISEKGWDL